MGILVDNVHKILINSSGTQQYHFRLLTEITSWQNIKLIRIFFYFSTHFRYQLNGTVMTALLTLVKLTAGVH